MITLTPARIAELLEICEAATEGPWRNEMLTENRMNPNSPVFDCVSNKSGQVLFRAHRVGGLAEEDARLIAAARTALPDALRDLTSAQEALAKVTAERDELRDLYDGSDRALCDCDTDLDATQFKLDTAEAELTAVEAENAVLREALEPFAKFDTEGFDTMGEVVRPDPSRADGRIEPICMADLRRARAVLTKGQTP